MWVRGSPTQRTGARRTSFPATIRQTYKSDGGPHYPWSGMQDMITVKTLARAIEKRLGGTGSEALAEARTVMSYFGFRTESLHDAGLLQTFWETVPLLDGRNWRIFYWALNERDVDRILAAEEPSPTEPLYNSLPDEAWGHSATGG